jgi:prepilin-type N-terminal cleavage/methylation domain-containing protein
MSMNRSERGLTLMEISISIVLIGMAAAGLAMFASNVMQGSKTEKVFAEITKIEQTIRSVYQNKQNYSTLDERDLADANLLPESLVDENGRVRTRFGRVYAYGIDIDCAGCEDGFSIVLRGIPSSICQKLATKDYGTRVTRIRVSQDSTNSNYQDVLGNIALANSQCQIEDSARIRWYFKG